jgi:protein subunit release factor A
MRLEDIEILAGCDAVHPDRRGGQHVAMHCGGVRVLHVPTGIAVTVISERSQIKSREKAMAMLEILVDLELSA